MPPKASISANPEVVAPTTPASVASVTPVKKERSILIPLGLAFGMLLLGGVAVYSIMFSQQEPIVEFVSLVVPYGRLNKVIQHAPSPDTSLSANSLGGELYQKANDPVGSKLPDAPTVGNPINDGYTNPF